MLTPDSSRFWPQADYVPGRPQPSFDKQFVRDHLEAIGWNKQPPVPSLPDDVIAPTRDKYLEAFRRLTGRRPAMMRDDLAQLVQQMIDRGILLRGRPEGVRADVHQPRAGQDRLQRLQGRQDDRPPPQHAQPQDDGTRFARVREPPTGDFDPPTGALDCLRRSPILSSRPL